MIIAKTETLTGPEVVERIFRKLAGSILARASGTAKPIRLSQPISVPFTDDPNGPQGRIEYGSFIEAQMGNARWAFTLGKILGGCLAQPFVNNIAGLEMPPAKPEAELEGWFRQKLLGGLPNSLIIGLKNGCLVTPKWLFDRIYWTPLGATLGTKPSHLTNHPFMTLAPNPRWKRKTSRVLARKIRDHLMGRIFQSWI